MFVLDELLFESPAIAIVGAAELVEESDEVEYVVLVVSDEEEVLSVIENMGGVSKIEYTLDVELALDLVEEVLLLDKELVDVELLELLDEEVDDVLLLVEVDVLVELLLDFE